MFAMTPQSKIRVLFYLVFTCFGLFHAEVMARSSPWVLLNPLMFLLVAPVYAVHYVVLGDLLLRKRQTGFFPVFIAGCILGMYEFVITKMFWTPTWTPFAPRVLEVAWAEVFWIGFWWHAFMSFAIPFFLVRKLVLERHPHPLKIKQVRYVLIGVPLLAATLGVSFGSPPIELLGSILLSLVVLFAVGRLFLLKAPAWGFKGPDDVLLGPTGRRRALAFLLFVYVFYGATMRLSELPSLVGLVLPAVFYLGLFALLYPFVRGKDAAVVAGAALPATPSAALLLALPTAATLPAMAPVGSSAPALPALAPPEAAAAIAALRRFLVRYALSFLAFVALCEGLAAGAPWVLFILYIVLVLQGGVGAAVLIAVAAWKSLRQWAALRAPPTSAPG